MAFLLRAACARASALFGLFGLVAGMALPGLAGVAISAAPIPAQAGNCWQTITPTGAQCYASADYACYVQFQGYAYTGIGPYLGAVDEGNPYARGCSWVWHPGDSDPSAVYWVCANNMFPSLGSCSGPGDNLTCNCNSGGTPSPSTPFPIEILTGNKRFAAVDFQDAAGSLSLRRVYASQANAGGSSPVMGDEPALGLATWRYDFQYELQFPPSYDSNEVVIVTPDGQQVGFYLNSSGTFSPVLNSNYQQPQSDYTLTYQSGALPSNLLTLESEPTTWTLTTPDDTVWTIQTLLDPQTNSYRVGRPTQMVRRDGLTWTFSYGPENALSAVTDSYGKTITFDWILQDQSYWAKPVIAQAISKAHLPNGFTVAYSYSDLSGEPAGSWPNGVTFVQADQLTNVQYLDGTGTVRDQVTYQYGDSAYPTFITGILDANGVQRWSVTYDAAGHATSSTGPSGAENYSVAYGTLGGSTFTRTVTTPLGKVATYTYQAGSSGAGLISIAQAASTNSPATTQTFTYGSDGYVASHTDENGNVEQLTHDPRGMIAQQVEASGTASARTTTTTWDSTRRLPTQVAAPGLTTSYAYDSPTGGSPYSGGGGGGVGGQLGRTVTGASSTTPTRAATGMERLSRSSRCDRPSLGRTYSTLRRSRQRRCSRRARSRCSRTASMARPTCRPMDKITTSPRAS